MKTKTTEKHSINLHVIASACLRFATAKLCNRYTLQLHFFFLLFFSTAFLDGLVKIVYFLRFF